MKKFRLKCDDDDDGGEEKKAFLVALLWKERKEIISFQIEFYVFYFVEKIVVSCISKMSIKTIEITFNHALC
jgi:hypothetical protein